MEFNLQNLIENGVKGRNEDNRPTFKIHCYSDSRFTRYVKSSFKAKKVKREFDIGDIIMREFINGNKSFSDEVFFDATDFFKDDIWACDVCSRNHIASAQNHFRNFFGLRNYHLFSAQTLLKRMRNSVDNLYSLNGITNENYSKIIKELNGSQKKVYEEIEFPSSNKSIELYELQMRIANRIDKFAMTLNPDEQLDKKLNTLEFHREFVEREVNEKIPPYKIRKLDKFSY